MLGGGESMGGGVGGGGSRGRCGGGVSRKERGRWGWSLQFWSTILVTAANYFLLSHVFRGKYFMIFENHKIWIWDNIC